MARTNRVRLSDDELMLVDEAAEEKYGNGASEDVPRGRVIGELAQDYLNGKAEDNNE